MLHSHTFNYPINHLPSTLKHLKLGSGFDQSIDNLPNNLHTLEVYFFGSFNQPINKLPSTLSILKLPFQFDSLVGHIPTRLEHLHIYNKSYDLNLKLCSPRITVN
jgi:hypothetical protein